MVINSKKGLSVNFIHITWAWCSILKSWRLVSILSFWMSSAGPAPQNPVRRPGAIQHMIIWNFVFDSRSLFSKNRPNGWGNWLEAAFDCRTMSATALWCCECLRPICHDSNFVKKQVSVTPAPPPSFSSFFFLSAHCAISGVWMHGWTAYAKNLHCLNIC